jgi:enterochelin esterase-like enzyme
LGAGGSYGLYNLNENFTKKGDSAWQVVLDPAVINYITPGFYYYGFQVNGVYTYNPNEKLYINTGFISGVEIPDPENDFYNIKDVPHGTIRMQTYYSTVTKTNRTCFIYLPPGYDTKSVEKYPVLFLQHGMNETQYSWHMQGKMNFILDNLIAEEKALPMIVVMDNGMNINYSSLVLSDLLPLLQNKYKIKTGKMNTAVAGLSMGSFQAAELGLVNSSGFAYVGAFCGGNNGDLYNLPKRINDSIEVLYNGYGITDETFLGQGFESMLNYLKINHITAEFSGGHEWQVWRKCLNQFAQLLFKPYTYENPFSEVTSNSQNFFSVYPNPFKGQIHFQCDSDTDFVYAKYTLHDITGKQILNFFGTKSDAELRISNTLNNSPSSVYILTVYSNSNVFQVKVVK